MSAWTRAGRWVRREVDWFVWVFVIWGLSQSLQHAQASSFEVVEADQFEGGSIDPLQSDQLKQQVLSFTFPLLESPDGLTPTVALQYEPSRTNGTVGAGWSLTPQSTITTHSRLGGAPEWDVNDIFKVDGVRLKPTGSGHYVPLYVNGWVYERQNNQEAWVATYQGQQKVYGHLDPGTACGQPGWSTRPGWLRGKETCNIVQWLQMRQTDDFGNAIEYGYTRYEDRPYLTEIRYNIHGADYFKVELAYEDRPDVRDDYRTERLRPISKRLASVRVSTHRAGIDYAVYHYDLEYEASGVGVQSLLTSIVQQGLDDAGEPHRKYCAVAALHV
ncbi:MAG: hypothetical protein AAGA48_02160 [Myxococcota bacterium]